MDLHTFEVLDSGVPKLNFLFAEIAGREYTMEVHAFSVGRLFICVFISIYMPLQKLSSV